MILRRVIAHFRKQEWTAIALDFVIVVLGVFIANQVTTWKDEAETAKRKAAAVERLHDESEAIVDYIRDRVDRFNRMEKRSADALARLSANNWAGADVESAADAFNSLALAPAAAPPRSAYDELIGAGFFAEIGDAPMRAAVADYYAYLSFLQAQIDYTRQGITAETAQRRFAGMRRVYDPAAFRSSRVDYDFAALSADEAFLDFAIMMNEAQQAQRQWWTLLQRKADAMCAEISRFDGKPCSPEEEGRGDEMFGATAPATNEQSKQP
jgi:hypothetical protein